MKFSILFLVLVLSASSWALQIITEIPLVSSRGSDATSEDSMKRKVLECSVNLYCEKQFLLQAQSSIENYFITGELDFYLSEIIRVNQVKEQDMEKGIYEFYNWLLFNIKRI